MHKVNIGLYMSILVYIAFMYAGLPNKSINNQRVENTGVAYVNGANERNEFFEKINKQ